MNGISVVIIAASLIFYPAVPAFSAAAETGAAIAFWATMVTSAEWAGKEYVHLAEQGEADDIMGDQIEKINARLDHNEEEYRKGNYRAREHNLELINLRKKLQKNKDGFDDWSAKESFKNAKDVAVGLVVDKVGGAVVHRAGQFVKGSLLVCEETTGLVWDGMSYAWSAITGADTLIQRSKDEGRWQGEDSSIAPFNMVESGEYAQGRSGIDDEITSTMENKLESDDHEAVYEDTGSGDTYQEGDMYQTSGDVRAGIQQKRMERSQREYDSQIYQAEQARQMQQTLAVMGAVAGGIAAAANVKKHSHGSSHGHGHTVKISTSLPKRH